MSRERLSPKGISLSGADGFPASDCLFFRPTAMSAAVVNAEQHRFAMQGSADWNNAFDLIEVAHFASRKIVEKEIDRSNATVPGDDKIGSRLSWSFARSAVSVITVAAEALPEDIQGNPDNSRSGTLNYFDEFEKLLSSPAPQHPFICRAR